MKTLIRFNKKIAPLNCMILFLGISSLLLFNSCEKSTESFSVIEFNGVDEISNFSKMLFMVDTGKSDTLGTISIPCSKNDIFVWEDFVFVYDDVLLKNKVDVVQDGNIITVNGNVYGLYIPEDESMLKWFESMNEHDLTALGMLYFDSKVNKAYLPFLKELSGIITDIGLYFEDEENLSLLENFDPRYLIGSFSNENFKMLSNLSNLEVLYMEYSDANEKNPLPALPNLKHVALDLGSFDGIFSEDIFINNPQLEKITILFSKEIDLSVLEPLSQLRELAVFVADTILNIQKINELKNLDILSIKVEEMDMDLRSLELPALKWLTITADVTQEEFDACLRRSPSLEFIEIFSNDTIKSYQQLIGLQKLEGLIISESLTDIASIKELNKLKYLSLPKEYLDDQENLEDLRQALPDVTISANEGFCLGSGWLLLLLPLVFIFRFIKRAGSEEQEKE